MKKSASLISISIFLFAIILISHGYSTAEVFVITRADIQRVNNKKEKMKLLEKTKERVKIYSNRLVTFKSVGTGMFQSERYGF